METKKDPDLFPAMLKHARPRLAPSKQKQAVVPTLNSLKDFARRDLGIKKETTLPDQKKMD
jgi:hypothetical protein